MVWTKRYLNTTQNPNIEQFALTSLSMFTHAPNQIEDPVTLARDEAIIALLWYTSLCMMRGHTKDVHLIAYFANRTSQINGSAAGPKTGIWRLLWQKIGKNRVILSCTWYMVGTTRHIF